MKSYQLEKFCELLWLQYVPLVGRFVGVTLGVFIKHGLAMVAVSLMGSLADMLLRIFDMIAKLSWVVLRSLL